MKHSLNHLSLMTKIIYFVLMAAAAVVILIPFIIMFFTSLKAPSEIRSASFQLFPEVFQWSNYKEAMTSSTWSIFFRNSLLITILAVISSLTINSLAGFAFARMRFKGRDQLFFLALTGMLIPIQVTMLPNYVVMRYFPLAGGNNILGQGGTGLINTWLGILAPNLAGAFGVFMFRQFFMNFPTALDDAAKVDGLGRLGAFFRIYIPLSKPVFATMIVLKTTSTWNEYTWPLIITTSRDKWTVQLALSVFKTEFNTQWHLLMAATVLITLPVLLLYAFLQQYFIEGITTTGIKA